MRRGTLTRRELLQLSLWAGAAVAVGSSAALLQGCEKEERKGPISCTDTSKLSERQLEKRQAEQYVEASTIEGESCRQCRHFLPGGANECGKCTKIMGPINPDGHCALWEKLGA